MPEFSQARVFPLVASSLFRSPVRCSLFHLMWYWCACACVVHVFFLLLLLLLVSFFFVFFSVIITIIIIFEGNATDLIVFSHSMVYNVHHVSSCMESISYISVWSISFLSFGGFFYFCILLTSLPSSLRACFFFVRLFSL